MKTNKILAGIVATSVLATGLWVASADFGDFSKSKQNHKIELTDSQKTEIENMSDEQKKEFFEAKKIEQKENKEARENVIDKLLAGEELNDNEETLRSEIIVERAERKLKQEEKQAEREALKELIEKKKAGEELTQDEESQLEEMKSHSKKWKKKWGKRKWNK